MALKQLGKMFVSASSGFPVVPWGVAPHWPKEHCQQETRVEHLPQKNQEPQSPVVVPESLSLRPQHVPPSAITGCQERRLERAIPELSRHEGVQGDEVGVGREGLRSERGVG